MSNTVPTDANHGAHGDGVASRSAAPLRRPERDIIALSGVLAVVAVALIATLPRLTEASRDAPAWAVLAAAVAFAVAEYSVFRFVFRRESIAFSLSEIPLAFSLVYLAPIPALIARVVGSLAVILVVRRLPLYKVLFNVVSMTFELALAYVVFRGIMGDSVGSDTQLVTAVMVATGIVGFVSSVLVAVAISRFEGDLRGRVGGEVRLAWWLFLVNATLAGMVLGLGLVSPFLILLASVPVGLLWYVIKAFGVVDQELRDLGAVHGFTGRVGQSLDPAEIGRAAVAETTRILRANGAALVMFDRDLGVTVQQDGHVDVDLPRWVDDPVWGEYIYADAAMLLSGRTLDSLGTSSTPPLQLLVAPVRDQATPIGLLVVGDHVDPAIRYGPGDVTRLQNLTDQLAASLHKGIMHQRIEREARQDQLTGLPNRSALERSIDDIAANGHDGDMFLVMLDLDRFKEVNDTLGHAAGDDLLREVARRLAQVIAPGDVLARLAGDEFALLGRRRTHTEMLELAHRVVSETGRPVTLDGLEIVVTASAGLAVADDGIEPSALLRHADIAMFNAKTQRLGVEIYRHAIDRRTPARLSMLGDLRAAIEAEDLDIHLQPKLDLSSGLVTGAEALVRWTHAVRGRVAPMQFVRVAEDTGLIKQLTDLMLVRGITTLRDIHDRGYHLGLAVNLSTHDLLDRRLPERVAAHLSAHAIDPSMLTLEITESSLLIDAPRARATINELHEVGVRLAVDDFGTGYSSLSYLRKLPVAELKIDQSFVANVLIDAQDEVIVRSTIDLGHNLGLVVVAEGVENNEVLSRLRQFGCDVAQGYCISRPLPPEMLLSWLATTSHPSQKTDPLDFSRWVDPRSPAGSTSDPAAVSEVSVEPDPTPEPNES